MDTILEQFLSAMDAAGLSPAQISDITPDDKRHDYQLYIDPRGKKKGFYKLKIDGDFGVGFFGDWRDGECHSWFSKSPVKATKEQKEAYRLRIEAEKARQEKEKTELQTAKAIEAQDFCLFLDDCKDHAYLAKKGVKAYGALISGNDLIIPMSDGEKVWNYQTIKPDGKKLFMPDAKKQGCWFEIKGSDTIAIVEGYATGASVHEATGYTVIVAFDAGNLAYIAPRIKELYPQAEIIICADNDHETHLKNGIPHNTGLIKGDIGAKSINARLVYPEFTSEDHGLSDFNDLHEKYGINAVKDRILGVLAQHDPRAVSGGDQIPSVELAKPTTGDFNAGWEKELRRDTKGNLIKNSTVNLLLLMSNHDILKDLFKYDSFAKRIIMRNCPPWENEQDFVVRPVKDFDYLRLEAFLEHQFNLNVTRDKCAEAINSTACLKENTFNPAADYFNSLEWDGKPRLDTWLNDYVCDHTQSKEYLSMVGRKFMTGLAGRAMEAGIKFDTMIILEGKQYAGKSYLSRIMSTINGVEYFLDDFKDIENKDTLMKMQGKLVVEFPEISAMRKAEINDLKAFLSRTTDVFRPPYGRNPIEAGRQCVFIGTVNPEGGYLRDVTGNRRYWPISCRDKLRLDDLKEVMPQLHAEAAHLFKQGEKLWLDEYQYNLAVVEQEKRVLGDIWQDKIADIVLGEEQISTDTILADLNIATDKQTPLMLSRISQTMISLGFHPARVTVGTKRKRGFKKHTMQVTIDEHVEEVAEWS